MTKRFALGLGFAAVALGLALAAWQLRTFPRVRAQGPNVVIYLVDTLRPDHLGVYGYDRETSPRLDAFAADAVVFENAYSPSSWTRPATASLLTGLSPSRHRAVGRLDVVRPELEVLSETLQAAGYRTLGFVANPNVLDVWGFAQGFETYRDVDSESLNTRADAVIDQALHALDALSPDERFFLYVHALDPHFPYVPPPPYDAKFALPENPDLGAYDGEIAFGDVHFGRLVDWLRARQIYDDTIVVFVSDHGEEMREHAGTEHGHTLFEEVVRIPFLIKLPGSERAGERVRAAATLMDVVPTLRARLGLPVPAHLDGSDLFAAASAAPAAPAKPLFFDLELDWHRGRTDIVRAVRVADLKLLRRLRPFEEESLYDLSRDPGEQQNLRANPPEGWGSLRELLDQHLAATATGIHLRASNTDWGGTQTCTAKLTTTGRFVGLTTRFLETGDRAELGDRDQEIDVSITLANYPHPTAGIPRVIIDEDSIAFEVEPRDAEIEIASEASDGATPCSLWLGPGHRRADGERLRFRATDPGDLALVDIASLLRSVGETSTSVAVGFHLAVVTGASEREVPEDMRARLRELGYLDEAD